MASLVVEWTRELQDESGVAEQQENADEAYFLRVRPTLDGASFGSGSMQATEITGLPGMQELAKKYFDPDKFTGIFTGGGGGPPKWLDGAKGLLADRSRPSPAPAVMLPLVLLSEQDAGILCH